MRKCSRCENEAPKGKKICSGCQLKMEADEKRRKENWRRWRTLSGESVEAPVWRTRAEKWTIFDAGMNGFDAVKPNDTIGRLLNALIGICFCQPEYISRNAAARYIVLIDELRNFKVNFPHHNPPASILVSDIPLTYLGTALEKWIFSYFEQPSHPLMPSFALDTARFIEKHAAGHDEYWGGPWRLKPLITCTDEERREFDFLCPEFKKEFTEKLGSILTLGRIPAGVSIRWYDRPIHTQESFFLFGFRRCYLSENWNDHYSLQMSIDNWEARPFDLMREFQFTGDYLIHKIDPGRDGVRIEGDDPEQVVRRALELQHSGQVLQVGGELPAEWITHVVDVEWNGQYTLLPVPTWEVEFAASSDTGAE